MTFSSPSIDRLYIEAFRGFRDAREFDLSASAVIVTGPNGTGKTSFFDALQWVLVGKLERLESFRGRKNVEHIVSRYRHGSKAAVEVDLRLSGGRVTLRRTGDQSGSTLELRGDSSPPLFGAEAEKELRRLLMPAQTLTLESALTTSGLMQQDVLRSVLEAKPAERYKQLTTILGLGRLEAFEDATKQVSTDASERSKQARINLEKAEAALQIARDRVEAANIRLSAGPQVDAMRAEVVELLQATPAGIVIDSTRIQLSRADQIRECAALYARRAVDVDAVLVRVDRLMELGRERGESRIDAEQLQRDLEAATSARDEAQADRSEAQSRLNAARQAAADVAKLAALAVPMLTERCPVCDQSIDSAHVERELMERASGAGVLLELETSFAAANNRWVEVGAEIATLQRLLSDAARDSQIASEIETVRLSIQDAVTALSDRRSPLYLDLIGPDQDAEKLKQLALIAAEYLRTSRQPLYDLLEAIDRSADQSALERAEAELHNIEAEFRGVTAELESAVSRARQMKELASATIDARVEVTERRLRSLQPLVADIYHRLDPHPAFKTVDFELDTYYRRGTTSPLVVDPVANVSADPLLVFSTSQANIVALSYFLAMSLSMGQEGLPFLLLDDPVQSMDDVNVLGFADLCRHLRHDRQLIVSTHERRLAGLLERKLAPRQEDETTRVIRFTGWDRSGPAVDEQLISGGAFDRPVVVLRNAS